MEYKIITCVLIGICFVLAGAKSEKKIFCFYEITEGLNNNLITELTKCTHLLVRPGKLEANKLVYPKDNNVIKDLKKLYPTLQILLSIGGEYDPVPNAESNKYMECIAWESNTKTFIDSIQRPEDHFYDGINLAWNFPTGFAEKKSRSLIWSQHALNQVYKSSFVGFLKLVKKHAEENGEYLVTVTINPGVNMPNYLTTENRFLSNRSSREYLDYQEISSSADYVILQAFDFYTPLISPNVAYFPAALYSMVDENVYANADFVVKTWIENGVKSEKIILSIPTFARAWKMNGNYTDAGISPFEVLGQDPSLDKASYKDALYDLRIIRDPVHNLGTYGFRFPTDDEPEGVWAGFDEEITAKKKAEYVLDNSLGGVAIDDINRDNTLTHHESILKSVHQVLKNEKEN